MCTFVSTDVGVGTVHFGDDGISSRRKDEKVGYHCFSYCFCGGLKRCMFTCYFGSSEVLVDGLSGGVVVRLFRFNSKRWIF